MSIEELRSLYPNETAHLVGKGPSLEYLDKSYFGLGPVITINQAILIVQELGLTNPIYSFQKDGCELGGCPGHECKPPRMVYPHGYIPLILIQHGYSEFCLSKHEKKVFIDPPGDFGFIETEMSIRIALAVAITMGCSRISLVCCDSFVGDMRTFDPLTRRIELLPEYGNYPSVIERMALDLEKIQHQIVIPKQRTNHD